MEAGELRLLENIQWDMSEWWQKAARSGTRLAMSRDAQHRAGNASSRDVKKICRSVVQRSSFDHCGAPGYNIAAGHCCFRLKAEA